MLDIVSSYHEWHFCLINPLIIDVLSTAYYLGTPWRGAGNGLRNDQEKGKSCYKAPCSARAWAGF